jgi:hypothetical protein
LCTVHANVGGHTIEIGVVPDRSMNGIATQERGCSGAGVSPRVAVGR